MIRRIGAWCLLACLLFAWSGAAVSAEETTVPSVTTSTTASAGNAIPLLLPEATVSDGTATFAYTPEGSLTVTASSAGAMVAIELTKDVDLDTMRYLQLSLTADVPFNLALKLRGADYDLYPQTTGPSWYEAFQDKAPAADTGVAAGSYTMSLDVLHYTQYNGLALEEDGTTTLKSVFLTLYAPGTVRVSFLKLGREAAFVTPDGKSGAAATTLAPITTHSEATKLPTKYAYYDGGDIAAIDDTVRQNEESPASVIVLVVIGVVLVAAMALLTLIRKRRDRLSLEEPKEE